MYRNAEHTGRSEHRKMNPTDIASRGASRHCPPPVHIHEPTSPPQLSALFHQGSLIGAGDRRARDDRLRDSGVAAVVRRSTPIIGNDLSVITGAEILGDYRLSTASPSRSWRLRLFLWK